MSYPNQRMEERNLDIFWTMFEKTFSKYDEQDVADAVESVIQTEKWFPSIATIKESLDNLLNAKRREAQSASIMKPAPRGKIDMVLVREAMRKVKKGEWVCPISDTVRTFATRLFPDITDDLIRRNYCLLAYYSESGVRIDNEGSFVKLYMTRHGDIVERVVYQKGVWQDDSFMCGTR